MTKILCAKYTLCVRQHTVIIEYLPLTILVALSKITPINPNIKKTDPPFYSRGTMTITPVGKYHTIICQEVVGSPGHVVPVLYLHHNDGSITTHPHLHEFMLAKRSKSLTWKRTHVRAVGLFWDLLRAIETMAKAWDPINIHRAIYRHFCEALRFGTINKDTKQDPMGLYWPAMGMTRAKKTTNAIEDFITWVANEAAGTGNRLDVSTLAKLSPQEINAFPTNSELATRFIVVAQKLKQLSMFSHLKSVHEMAWKYQQESVNQLYDFGPSQTSFDADPAIYMAPELVAAFLQYGFVKDENADAPEDREDISAKMIFELMAFGGLRISEPFHLWFNDVLIESEFSCKVILRHPVDAETHILGEECLRNEYLSRRGMLPRNLDYSSGSYHAGWKNLATDKSLNAPVFWISSSAEAEFSALYVRYLIYRKKLIAQRRLRGLPDHPFLFVSAGEDRCAGISHVGDPYTITAFKKAWKKALHKVSNALGRNIIESKENGTTPHAPRHFYGQALSDASTNKKAIQKALRHRSVLSQGPYTVPDFKRVSAVLSDARKRIEEGCGQTFDFSTINSVLTHFGNNINY